MLDRNYQVWWYSIDLLLMVQKSQTTTWDGAKTVVNNGIDMDRLPTSSGYSSRISEPLTVSLIIQPMVTP